MQISKAVCRQGFPVVLILSCLIFALAGCESKGTSIVENSSANSPSNDYSHDINTDDPVVAQDHEKGDSQKTDPEPTANSGPDVAQDDSKQVAKIAKRIDAANKTVELAEDADRSIAADKSGASDSDSDTEESPFANIPLPEEEMEQADGYKEVHTIDLPKTWTRISPEGKSELWFDGSDPKNKKIIVGGVVVLRRGGLEMFICPLYTKEHESVIAVNAQSSEIHAALLVCGAKPGSPVQWHPDYKSAHGPKVKITVIWKEGDKIVKRNGKEMVRDMKTRKALDVDWVFGGSRTYTDPEEGYTVYYGDGGELVCVSNFSTATMDLPVKSPDSNEHLLYEAFTEHIPPPGTKVYVQMQPEVDDQSEKEKPVDQPQDAAEKKEAADGASAGGKEDTSRSDK